MKNDFEECGACEHRDNSDICNQCSCGELFDDDIDVIEEIGIENVYQDEIDLANEICLENCEDLDER